MGREAAFDRISHLAAKRFDVPIVLVSIVGEDVQCFRGACGIDALSTSRDVAFCAFAILENEVMVVANALEDPRFVDNPLVTGEPFIRFYAGAPLTIQGSPALGTLCLIDRQPRIFTDADKQDLRDYADAVADLIELRVGSLEAEARGAALGLQQQLLRTTVESIGHGLAVFDPEMRLVLWNELILGMFQFPPERARAGLAAVELLRARRRSPRTDADDPDSLIAGLLDDDGTRDTRRVQVRYPDGRALEVTRSTMPDGLVILISTDVTEQLKLARLKDEFVSTVSHELRTPLTSIVGSLGLLGSGAAGALPARAAQLVDIAHKNGKRLNLLINDLLDVDKLEAGQGQFQFGEVELGALLNQAAEQNQPYAEKFGVTIAFERPAAEYWVRADMDRLLQVMANLLSNAVKYSPSGGAVTIELSRRGGDVLVSVADKGPGIPEHFRSQIFKRFSQADGSDQRSQQGTGLGLAITRAIIQRHGGQIGFETSEGEGTVFEFTLPALRDGSENRAEPVIGIRQRLLICAADERSGASIGERLRATFDIDVAVSLSAARQQLDRSSYAAVLLDAAVRDDARPSEVPELFYMPATSNVPILLLARKGGDGEEAWTVARVVDRMARPIENEALSEVVHRLAQGRRGSRPRVLHVEDDADLLRVTALALGESADLDAAPDLDTARKLLAAGGHDLVILDLKLGDESGLDLLPDIAAAGRDIPIIIFSASEPANSIEGLVTCSLTKGKTSVEELAAVVRGLIDTESKP